ncbi:MAG TPA: cytochrome c biogenesis protein ResB [bacterium]|nr:cytochrome c biogenesis protein ResB [bacterium]
MNPFKENRILRFLGSVQLALPMLLVLAVLLAAGTIVESRFSTAVAKRFVYGTWWFGSFLVLLGINLICSAFSRFPWKKYQTGFVVTHLGIVCILAGSFATQQWGLDGQIALQEGGEGHSFQQDKPTLYYQSGDGPVEKIPAAFPFRVPDPDHPFRTQVEGGGLLMVDQFYLNAQRTTQGRATAPGEKGYPAVHIQLDSSFVHQDTWLFQGHPDYGRIDLGPASVYFEGRDGKKGAQGRAGPYPPNALVVIRDKDGLKFKTRFHGQWQAPQTVQPGQAYATGWMDMQFRVREFLPSAQPESTFLPLPLDSQKDLTPALHYEFLKGAEHEQGWLGYQDQPVSFLLPDKGYFSMAYGPQRLNLPFAIHLTHFEVGFDPGTEKAASYTSEINYIDPEQGVQTPYVISMNHPLHYQGYTVYQASYEKGPDGKYTSVFSVGMDPGLWLKYGGALVMVLGIILMFWFKNPAWGKKADDVQN